MGENQVEVPVTHILPNKSIFDRCIPVTAAAAGELPGFMDPAALTLCTHDTIHEYQGFESHPLRKKRACRLYVERCNLRHAHIVCPRDIVLLFSFSEEKRSKKGTFL